MKAGNETINDNFELNSTNYTSSDAINGTIRRANGTLSRITESVDEIMVDRSRYVYIYSALIVVVLYLVFQRALALYLFCLRASHRIHEKLLQSVIRAKMYFFSTNSSGRVVNRFSKDLYDIDYYLALVLYDLTLVSVTILLLILNITCNAQNTFN